MQVNADHAFTGHKSRPDACCVIVMYFFPFFWLMHVRDTDVQYLSKFLFLTVFIISLRPWKNLTSRIVNNFVSLSPVTDVYSHDRNPKKSAPDIS